MKSAKILRAAVASLAITGLAMGGAFAASLDAIKERGKLIIGAEIASPPYISREGDTIIGYEPDILAYMAEKLGVELEIVDAAWSGILPALLTDKFDAVYSGMTVTKDRLERVGFAAPYAQDPPSIMVRGDSGIESITDMAGKRLGFAFGGALTPFIEAYNETLVSQGLEPMELVTYETPLDAIADLMNGRVDAALNKRSTLARYVQSRAEGEFTVVSDLKAMVDLTYLIAGAVPKDNTTLLEFMNESIAELAASGKLAELQVKWFGETMEVPTDFPDNLP